MKCVKNQGIRSGRRSDLVHQSNVNSTNEKVIREKSNISIIRRSVRVRKVRKGISGAHGRTWNVNEMKIKVLQEHHPASLAAR